MNRRGRRPRGSLEAEGEHDEFDSEVFERLRSSMRALATDGGPSEAKACYEAVRPVDPLLSADPLFPNVSLVFRDVPHRHRDRKSVV